MIDYRCGLSFCFQLHAQGLSQNRIMAIVFPDIKKGGSKPYYDARDIYRTAIGAIVLDDAVEDEDETDE